MKHRGRTVGPRVAAAVAVVMALGLAWSGPALAEDEQPTAVQVACQRLAEADQSETVGVEVLHQARPTGDPTPVSGCIDAGTGAWYVGIVSVGDPSAEAFRWEVHHVAGDGAVATFVPPPPPNSEWLDMPEGANLVVETSPEIVISSVFDFHGDGEPELAASVSHSMVEDLHAVYVLEARDGGVAPMALPYEGRLRGAYDIEGDGRTDLVFEGPYALYWSCGDAGWDGTFVFPVVAHAVGPAANGGEASGETGATFSMDDRIARIDARVHCQEEATPSEHLVVPAEWAPFDPSATVKNIACARYLGRSADSVTAQLREELAAVTAATPESEWECMPSVEALLALPQGEPPFTLE